MILQHFLACFCQQEAGLSYTKDKDKDKRSGKMVKNQSLVLSLLLFVKLKTIISTTCMFII